MFELWYIVIYYMIMIMFAVKPNNEVFNMHRYKGTHLVKSEPQSDMLKRCLYRTWKWDCKNILFRLCWSVSSFLFVSQMCTFFPKMKMLHFKHKTQDHAYWWFSLFCHRNWWFWWIQRTKRKKRKDRKRSTGCKRTSQMKKWLWGTKRLLLTVHSIPWLKHRLKI